MLHRIASRRATWRRLVLGAALLLVLLPRALIPVGYMPDHASPGALRMCASGFPAALLAFSIEARMAAGAMDHMDAATHAAHMGHGGPSASGGEHCEFAVLGAAGLLPSAARVAFAHQLVLLLATRPSQSSPLSPRHFLPPVRGPPAHS